MTESTRVSRKWRGKACLIKVQFEERAADLFLLKEGKPLKWSPDFTVVESFQASINGDSLVATEPRIVESLAESIAADQFKAKLLPLKMGQANGLERNPEALSGRHALTKAISLAVHLGASRIYLEGVEHVGPRTMRNLETTFRPLKGRRVTLATLDGDLPNVERAEVAK